ncbi:MAG: hypothetical protein M0D53_04155 [Flavobacterium sp. JAD_PAG50586_2]|nr:MAG: hypothetical protein M0D53_04155 [Flavobacterium sp. JAD_PAG50586_2]
MSHNLEERIKFLENQFNFYYKEVRTLSGSLYTKYYEFNPEYDDIDDMTMSAYWTHEYLYRMYNIICVYFETLGLNDYLREFISVFGPIVKDEAAAIKITSQPLTYGDTTEDLFLIIEWKKFLSPFSFFWDKPTENRKLEIKKLIGLLECTNEIIKITKTQIRKEEDINAIIRQIVDLYYTDVKPFSIGYFQHKFSDYRPDVLIGELGIAIEYKLIRTDKDISTKIDELIVDAKQYTENILNKKCIAVLCLTTKVTITKKQINEYWKKRISLLTGV